MSKKITPAEYDAWLEQDGRGFVALEPYVGSATKIMHQCSKGHQWPAVPKGIKEGKSCPYCTSHSPKRYAEWLEQDGRGYVALEPYVKTATKILHQCSEGHQWSVRPSHIKQGKNCPHCSGQIPPDYNEWLEQDGRGIIALEPYTMNNIKIMHQCREGHQWLVAPKHIKGGNGCPHCSGRIPQDYYEWLELDGRGYVALEPYINAETKIKHQCLEGHQWSASPHNIKKGTGCSDCCKSTSDANVFYIWENVDDAGVYKVGITSERCAEKRIAECTGKNKMKANIILIAAVSDAREIESKALEIGEAVDYPSSLEGYTEFRRYTDQELGEVYQLAVRSA